MELYFLAVLVLLMVIALSSGFPVAFALPGSAVLSMAFAALCGLVFEGNPDAYFAQGGAIQWLSAGVTNFRSLYWDVERDTLIAIPLFIFMGIMLQRSKIAEDLLVAMAQLFGPVPGGLGISVVVVGALLAATTGIVGATVIAMGLISLPVMLRNNYSQSLASGTICATGTLGQIIPPSIVLIILADQLANAVDQAKTAREAEYKAATGEFSMPSVFDITSASAGDMFMGAFIPGLVLVGLYVLYIFTRALIRPKDAPPVPYEGDYDLKFTLRMLKVLVPPLTLIFLVLGSIILGIATVNQAGSIGAVGAMIMGGYRLTEGKRHCFTPAFMAVGSIVALAVILSFFDINIKNIKTDSDVLGVILACIAVTFLLVAVGWSTWRSYTVENTLVEVMTDTAKTTSMVFIILIGAAMLTSAFRGFGGEELVKHYLTSLPGGFWTQFVVVMLVIFLLGFFLDFIEIAVVVVPIVAPILLTDPSANITAVWLGVMVGLNMQTSFLTPPFGFALFYLRGVAPPEVKTSHIYNGAVAFIILQLVGLAIAGNWPSLVNYLPYRTYLTADAAPPPVNPRLQLCLEEHVFDYYDNNQTGLNSAIDKFSTVNFSYLPEKQQSSLADSVKKARATFDRVEDIRRSSDALDEYVVDYRPVHKNVRQIRRFIVGYDRKLEGLDDKLKSADESDTVQIAQIEERIAAIEKQKQSAGAAIPDDWKSQKQGYTELYKSLQNSRRAYQRNVDESYEVIVELRDILTTTDALIEFEPRFSEIESQIDNPDNKSAMDVIKSISSELSAIKGVTSIKSKISKVRRALKGDSPKRDKARNLLAEAQELYVENITWRQRARKEITSDLDEYNDALKSSIGLRLQERFTADQASAIAGCQSVHRDISLNF